MAGHKRPYGAPICPRDETAPASSPTPPLTLEPTLPVVSAAGPSKTARRGLTPDFVFNPSASGYWHRKNPNWVDPDTFPKPNSAFATPQRGESWVSTERDDGSSPSPSHRPKPPLTRNGVIHIDVEEERGHSKFGGSQMDMDEDHEHEQDGEGERRREDLSDTQSVSSASSDATIMKRLTRGLSHAIGRSTPLASLYSSPRDELTAITTAAEAEGLYTRVVHHGAVPPAIKAEPTTPSRTTPAREHSWWVAVGRDRGAVDALVESHSPRGGLCELPNATTVTVAAEHTADEPYNFDRGLDRGRNERVGTYPVDPRHIRNTFLDTLLAGAVGGLVMFYCLSTV